MYKHVYGPCSVYLQIVHTCIELYIHISRVIRWFLDIRLLQVDEAPGIWPKLGCWQLGLLVHQHHENSMDTAHMNICFKHHGFYTYRSTKHHTDHGEPETTYDRNSSEDIMLMNETDCVFWPSPSTSLLCKVLPQDTQLLGVCVCACVCVCAPFVDCRFVGIPSCRPRMFAVQNQRKSTFSCILTMSLRFSTVLHLQAKAVSCSKWTCG